MTYRVEYDSNNSGGSWWLEDSDWDKLRENGWILNSPEFLPVVDTEGETPRFLGAKATGASKIFNASSEREAEEAGVADWECILGMDAYAEGCNCCGRPHYFWAEEVTE